MSLVCNAADSSLMFFFFLFNQFQPFAKICVLFMLVAVFITSYIFAFSEGSLTDDVILVFY